jgi:hypothetical protein
LDDGGGLGAHVSGLRYEVAGFYPSGGKR